MEKDNFMQTNEHCLAFKNEKYHISIQECDNGYDYSIYDFNYNLLDGGVYENYNISIKEAVDDLFSEYDNLVEIDYSDLHEKVNVVNSIDNIVDSFRIETEKNFKSISNQNASDIESTVLAYVVSQIEECDLDITIVDAVLCGSRSRGLERTNSDINVVLEYKGDVSEEVINNSLKEYGIRIAGLVLNIKPITANKSGTLIEFLKNEEIYLEDKSDQLINLTPSKLDDLIKSKGKTKHEYMQETIFDAIKKEGGHVLSHISQEMRNNKDFVMRAIKIDPTSYIYASERLREDKEVATVAVSMKESLITFTGKLQKELSQNNYKDTSKKNNTKKSQIER